VSVDDAARPIAARGLHDVLRGGLEELNAGGRDARTLADNLPRLVATAERLLARRESGAAVDELVPAAGKELAEQLALPDDEARGFQEDLEALRAELPEGGRAFDLRPETPLHLYLTVLSAIRAPLTRRFTQQLEKLREELRDLLRLDHMSSDEGQSPQALASELGGAATLHLDLQALSDTLPKSPGWATLGERRRQRIEETLATIESHLESDEPPPSACFLRPPDVDLQLPDAPQSEHPDPLAAAVGYFDGVAQRMASLFRAVRLARMEVEGSYRPEIHDAQLAGLDWEAFTAEELTLLPAVTVVTTGRHLRHRGQGSLSELLRSSRPVHVVVRDEVGAADEAEDLSLFHLDLGHLVMAHRETFAVSSTLARPERLVERLTRMFREPRPGVVLVPLPVGAPAPWRPLMVEAALQGRACPDFVYDPDAGPSWADRFDVDGNPDPECAWPVRRTTYLDDGAEHTLDTALTFADAVALEPAYQRHLRTIPRVAWQDEIQIPLAEYIARFEPGKSAREIPFLWVIDDAGTLQRAVVTRELALACRDRLRGWRVFQELGGYDNAYAERAAAAAREAALAEAADERAELEQAHAEALSSARSDGAHESMEQLAATLLNRDALALTAAAPAPAAPLAAEPALEAAAEPAPAEEAPEEEEEALSFDEPYIDTILCTSCNECTNINSRLFNYNADKQAFIADATAGTFADLVKAAGLCPAHCIHPAKPRSDDATATPELIARAAKFN
jgi:ferredoxin